MSLKLPKYNDDQLSNLSNKYPPLKEGNYKFTVIDVEEKLSKFNNCPQAEITMEVYINNNFTIKCKAWFDILEEGQEFFEKSLFKNNCFLESIGLSIKDEDAFYKAKTKEGLAFFTVRKYIYNDEERETLEPKKFLKDEVIKSNGLRDNTTVKKDFVDDDIPF